MKLEEGEVLCPLCKGNNHGICFRCGGTGKLDWVDICMGRLKFGTLDITLPIVRKMYAKAMAKDLVSVQPIEWDEWKKVKR